MLGVARWGRNGWGAALLMRDVSDDLPVLGDEPISEEMHAAFLDGIAALAAPCGTTRATWVCSRTGCVGRGSGPNSSQARSGSASPKRCPASPPKVGSASPSAPRADVRGRSRGAAPRHVTAVGRAAHHAADVRARRLEDRQPRVRGTDGRVVLLDWAYPGEGPVCHELAWYLAINRARIPVGHTKESTIADFRAALERHGDRDRRAGGTAS